MGTCMGNPRNNHDLMKNTNLEKRYISSQPVKVKKDLIVASSQGTQLKIKKSLFVCSICMQNYNLNKRQPIIACSNHHTYCRQCLQSAAKYNQKCPQCRSNLLPLTRNRDIYQLVEDNLKQLQENKLEEIQQIEQSNYLLLTINNKNDFLNNFWIEGNRIMKIDDDRIWEGFISNQRIYRDRQCIFTIKIVHSKYNNIEIGVVGEGYQLQKNITCKQSNVYHPADGMILEGIPGRTTQWKNKGQKILPGKDIKIQVRVNIPNKSISWFNQNKQVGQARLSDYILSHECVAYILMSHKDDIVQINS